MLSTAPSTARCTPTAAATGAAVNNPGAQLAASSPAEPGALESAKPNQQNKYMAQMSQHTRNNAPPRMLCLATALPTLYCSPTLSSTAAWWVVISPYRWLRNPLRNSNLQSDGLLFNSLPTICIQILYYMTYPPVAPAVRVEISIRVRNYRRKLETFPPVRIHCTRVLVLVPYRYRYMSMDHASTFV